ncbi:MAG: cysteine hydrolase [Bacteroidia bacterium]|nr:cysteine hydrolase [Bacteroidia bacterium]
MTHKIKNRTALLVIDLQRWFLEVGSKEKLDSVNSLIQNTNQLIELFEAHELPIFKVQTVHKADKSTWNQWALENNVARLIEGSREAKYSPMVKKVKNEVILTKTRLSAFLRTELETQLKSLSCNRLVICGYSTDNCVGQTSIDAYELDFKVLLAKEAILGTTPAQGQLMLDSLKKRFGILPLSHQDINQLIQAEIVF